MVVVVGTSMAVMEPPVVEVVLSLGLGSKGALLQALLVVLVVVLTLAMVGIPARHRVAPEVPV